MKQQYTTKTAIIPALIAAAALGLAFSLPISAEGVAGFIVAILLAAIAALEYRLSWKSFRRPLVRIRDLILDGIRHIPASRLADGTI